jgi:hypothetical protein
MHLAINDIEGLVRYTNFPAGYPQGHPVDGDAQVPTLNRVLLDFPPEQLVAFDDRKRALTPATAAIHFYRDDVKFDSVLRNPLEWVARLTEYAVLLTPDSSLGDDMPSWLRQQRTCYSRAVGATWQSRGLRVVPTLRWRSLEDISFVTSGIPFGSTIAMSNYGARRDPSERYVFKSGAEQVLRILKPNLVLLYGSLEPNLQSLFAEHTRVMTYPSPVDNIRNAKRALVGPPDNQTLF